MKRLIVIVALPLLLAVVWMGGSRSKASANAGVTIDTDKVIQVRGVVINSLNTVGATKSEETTDFTEGGTSILTFRVPPARLEEALTKLSSAGGTVTDQRIDLSDLNEQSQSVAGEIVGVGGCLRTLQAQIERREGASTEDLRTCQNQVDAVAQRLNSSPSAGEDAVLHVTIKPIDRSNPFLYAFIAIVAAGLGIGAIQLLRSTRTDDVVDVTDRPQHRVLDDLYNRRN